MHILGLELFDSLVLNDSIKNIVKVIDSFIKVCICFQYFSLL